MQLERRAFDDPILIDLDPTDDATHGLGKCGGSRFRAVELPRLRERIEGRYAGGNVNVDVLVVYSDNQDENLPTIRMRESPPLALGGRA